MQVKSSQKKLLKSKSGWIFFSQLKIILFLLNRMRGGEPDMAKVAVLRKELGDNLDVYEYILSKQSYIGGEVRYSFIDRILFILIN